MRPLGVATLLIVVGLGLSACAPPPLQRGLQLYDDDRYLLKLLDGER